MFCSFYIIFHVTMLSETDLFFNDVMRKIYYEFSGSRIISHRIVSLNTDCEVVVFCGLRVNDVRAK